MSPEVHQDVFRLPGLHIVENLGLISSHGLELNIQLEAGLVPSLGDILLCEAPVLHTTDQPLPIVTGLGSVLHLLHLLHAPVLLGLVWQVLHLPSVGILAQHPAELDGWPGSVRDTGNLEHQSISVNIAGDM